MPRFFQVLQEGAGRLIRCSTLVAEGDGEVVVLVPAAVEICTTRTPRSMSRRADGAVAKCRAR